MSFVFVSVQGAQTPHEVFPIEIAWVHESGQSETHLIRPPEQWRLHFRAARWKAAAAGGPSVTLDALIAAGEDLEIVAARLRSALRHPDRQVVADGEVMKKRLDCLLFQASHEEIAVDRITVAYLDACHPLLSTLPPYRSPDYQSVQDSVGKTCADIVARARRAESARPADAEGALGHALSLWRIWRDIAAEAERIAPSLPETCGEG